MGNLQDEAGHGSDRKDEADIELEPTDRCQIGGCEGAPAGLNVGHEKGEPVETAQACAPNFPRHDTPAYARNQNSNLRLVPIIETEIDKLSALFRRNDFSHVFDVLLDFINLRMHVADQIVLGLRQLFDAFCHFVQPFQHRILTG
jgi:hypothetical protein